MVGGRLFPSWQKQVQRAAVLEIPDSASFPKMRPHIHDKSKGKVDDNGRPKGQKRGVNKK